MAEWQFLLNENIDPKVTRYLEKEDIHAVHVREAIGQGADDEADILPHATDHDLIIVTSDVTDFGALSSEDHAGIVLLHEDALPAYRVASGLIRMVDAYPSRGEFTGREVLDVWC